MPGNATASGTALINAVNGISNGSSTKHYVVKVEPGIYDVGNSQVVMNSMWTSRAPANWRRSFRGRAKDTALERRRPRLVSARRQL